MDFLKTWIEDGEQTQLRIWIKGCLQDFFPAFFNIARWVVLSEYHMDLDVQRGLLGLATLIYVN